MYPFIVSNCRMFVRGGIDTIAINYRLGKQDRHFSTEVMKTKEWYHIRVAHELKQPRNPCNVFTKKSTLTVGLNGKEFADEEGSETTQVKDLIIFASNPQVTSTTAIIRNFRFEGI